MAKTQCPTCGKVELEQTVIPRRETRLDGIDFVVTDAQMYVCGACGESIVSADELKRWRRVLEGAN